ncbi:MAG TPA: DUF433 domain-containing protein [Ktedonobacterales bacterium]|jgi:uncharacterized protein (DUF433 family)
MPATDTYTHLRGGVWYVGATRVTLYSVISMWREGYAPEEIPASFPALTLQQVYGAIVFYLERRADMDTHFQRQDTLFAGQKQTSENAHVQFFGEIRERIARARASSAS